MNDTMKIACERVKYALTRCIRKAINEGFGAYAKAALAFSVYQATVLLQKAGMSIQKSEELVTRLYSVREWELMNS